MGLKSITVQLQDESHVYLSFFNALKSFQHWHQPFRGQWVVSTNLSCEELTRLLREHLRPNDSLLVAEISDWTLTGVG